MRTVRLCRLEGCGGAYSANGLCGRHDQMVKRGTPLPVLSPSVVETPPTDWMARGACVGHPEPELWFAVGTSGPALELIDQAKSICRPCSVREACLRFALATRSAGVWGGTTDDERAQIARSRRLSEAVVGVSA